MPDDRPETLALLARHAYAFVQDTQVEGRYDAAASAVETTFTATVQVMEGPDHGPLLGLYPHHWHNNPSVAGRLGPSYDTVRGPLRLLAASSFKTTRPYTGFVPHWPRLAEGPRLEELNDHLKRDLRRRRELIPARENADNWPRSVSARTATPPGRSGTTTTAAATGPTCTCSATGSRFWAAMTNSRALSTTCIRKAAWAGRIATCSAACWI